MTLGNNIFDYTSLDFDMDVFMFNEVAGNMREPLNKEELIMWARNQAARIKEEADETVKACHEADVAEILDGAIDVLVTAYGLLHKLQVSGFNVYEAMQLTAHNNLSKFLASYAEAIESVKFYEGQGVEVAIDEYQDDMSGDKYFILKRTSDNKIMKPMNYVANDLTSCLNNDYVEDANHGSD